MRQTPLNFRFKADAVNTDNAASAMESATSCAAALNMLSGAAQ